MPASLKRIERTHRIGPVIIDVDDLGEETTRQKVIVKFKSWGDCTKVYRARKAVRHDDLYECGQAVHHNNKYSVDKWSIMIIYMSVDKRFIIIINTV